MTPATITRATRDILADHFGVVDVTDDQSLTYDLGADSLDVLELVMELEEEFDVNIPDDAAEKITTVGQAVRYIEGAQSA